MTNSARLSTICPNETNKKFSLIWYSGQFRDPLELFRRSAVEKISLLIPFRQFVAQFGLASTLYLRSNRNKIHRFHYRKSLRFALDVDLADKSPRPLTVVYDSFRHVNSYDFFQFD